MNESHSESGPSLAWKAVNFGRAIVRHVADQGREVTEDQYQARLLICAACPWFHAPTNACRHESCGCRLQLKARWQSEDCPLGKWPAVEEGA